MPSYQFNSKKAQAVRARNAKRHAAERHAQLEARRNRAPSLDLKLRIERAITVFNQIDRDSLDSAMLQGWQLVGGALDQALIARTHTDAMAHLRYAIDRLPQLFGLVIPRG